MVNLINHPVEESLFYKVKANILSTALKELHELTWADFLTSHSPLSTLVHFPNTAVGF